MTGESGTPVDTGAGYQEGSTDPLVENKAPPTEKAPPAEKTPEGSPLTALVQERQGRRDDIGALQAEVQSLRSQLATPTPDAPWKNPHDPTEAPVDHLNAEMAHLRAELDEAKQGAGERITQQENNTALADFERGVLTELQIGMGETPELGPAYSFVSQRFGEMAKATGATGAGLAQQVRSNLLQAYLTGAQQGKSAGEVTAQLALGLGYQTAAPKVDPVKRGEEAAAQSLGGATGGGGATTGLSATQLTGMSKEQLKANDGAGLKRIKAMLRGEASPE